MASCASSVLPPMCGVRMTLANPASGVENPSPFSAGSSGKTSTAAPPTWPLFKDAASATRSTTLPRLLFTNMAPGFMFCNCAAPIKLRVEAMSGTCSDTKSEVASTASMFARECALPSANLRAVSKNTTRIPNDSASTLSWLPMCPYPIIPSVRPRTSREFLELLSQRPTCNCELF